ncbi:MAG: phosphoribosylformylglycinamidine synthase, partial [Oscillospiraceae bacterium]|nr:phosphoribosylformylglycinamidine synthase [Oscillospiraceae bacterium]
MTVYTIYVEKKHQYAAESTALLSDLKTALRIAELQNIRILNRYDVWDISQEDFEAAKDTVFSEPQVDLTYESLPEFNGVCFAAELLPGQFDQRSDSCEQCIQILTQKQRCHVRNTRVYILEGSLSDYQTEKIKSYIINPIEMHETSPMPSSVNDSQYGKPSAIRRLYGFIDSTDRELAAVITDYSLAMDLADIQFCREYFRKERREPTVTELRVIDTYWSDHCRHTTFLTNIKDVTIEDKEIRETYKEYLSVKEELGLSDRPVTLMDLATVASKKLKADGKLEDLDESDEINACSVKITVDVDGVDEDWLLMFKNETHNHPTEIEPFGGAATCLGGAIRDPLSGRSYVYQAMRVTGSADPRQKNTLKNKLPQSKITKGAAD